MVKLTLKVKGMDCSHCENNVRKAVTALGGVVSVDISLRKKTVDVSYEGSLTREAVVAAIQAAGYTVVK